MGGYDVGPRDLGSVLTWPGKKRLNGCCVVRFNLRWRVIPLPCPSHLCTFSLLPYLALAWCLGQCCTSVSTFLLATSICAYCVYTCGIQLHTWTCSIILTLSHLTESLSKVPQTRSCTTSERARLL